MSDATPQAQAPPARPSQKPLGHRLLLLAVIIAVVVIVYFIAAATIPRWWAQRIGDQVDGSGTAGVSLGLFYGFVFTFFALLVLSFALVRRRAWRWRAWLVAGAVVLALPNLFTLGVVLGTGSAAHAGERTLDVRAPYFRGSVLAGAIVAALAVVGVRYLMASRRRHKRREGTLRDELRTRDEAEAEAARAAGPSDEAAQ
ncbi:MAG TPA: hypothetical protein VFG74_12680 [Miltoncostaeaceae bacterium]|nr:hypothetical protein [Miltoncostaeaceae bacterium]